ncbi:MAG: hypothetical protein GYA34_11930 [Chloroflexi bacterium]|nr:hypothetical protein [Chloroflexota bacterium]
MKSNKLKIIIGFITMILSILACSLPAQFTSKPTASTPDITLTSIVAQLYMQATMTAEAPLQVATDTPMPTSTLVPTATIPPTTQVPPTETSTSTIEPTVSYEGPNSRPGPSIDAIYLYDEPTIDGVLDEWDMDRYYADNVVYGDSQWKGDEDLSANFMVGWDENYLYLAAKVKDDKYVQKSSGKNLFKGDSVQMLIDTVVSKDYYLEELDKDDFQLGISPGSPKPGKNSETYLWYPSAYEGEKKGVKIGSMEIEGGYRIEVKIPWEVFRTDPKKGDHFGFVFSISDNDKSGESIQQSMVSNVARAQLFNPTTWGDLTLVGAPIPDKRPGQSLEAEFLSSAPNIDGDLNDWSLDAVEVSHVTYGDEKWGGDSDLSGNVMVGWNNDYLFLGAEVVDDHYQQRMKGDKIYLGDSLEILFDKKVQEDYLTQRLDNDDYQLGISPGLDEINTNPSAYMWFPLSKEGGKSKVKIAAAATSDGYIVEVAIPWNAFDVSPKKGQHYGFVFSISDNDHSHKNVQQTIVSTFEGRVYNDPTTWGDLVLIK